ncbi:putative Nucleolar protein 14 [Hypsibius exemplaris]|uniref:Nucleolar protein 14 n=1 Tax=Hypsibius exemplaris TaxID=2072580 RepID=A0A1W0WYK0_HYPEX|nr:putative Nucleolar protein 14 [Hypsibius exemplaris]
MKPPGKRSLSDKLSRRPATTNRDVRKNPFELFLTKAKHVVAGRNTKQVFDGAVLGKFQKKAKPGGKQKQTVLIETQGLRSVSRNTAQTNRKKTLLAEYKTRTKSNKLVDRRLGERDATMTIEDKMMERVMYERKQSAKTKRGLFNLNDSGDPDDEELNFGQSLAEVERAEDDGDEEEEDGRDGATGEEDDILGEKFVSEHHFGGGLLTKAVRPENGGAAEAQHPKQVKADRNLLIDDIIAESKEKKYAKQSELDEIRDMTKALDEKWSDVDIRRNIFSAFGQAAPEPPAESYDSLVRMLQFDSKAKASNKLKSDSELAKDAKEELDKAERQRLKPAVAEAGIEMLDPESGEESEPDSGDEEEVQLSDIEVEEEEDVRESVPDDKSSSTAIPFVIAIPAKRKELEALLANRTPEESATIVQRIMQYHHISLAEENRAKLTKFTGFLFDFALTRCDERPLEALELWKLLTPSLVELIRISADAGVEFIRSRLQALSGIVCRKVSYTLVSSAVFFLKFVALCYPASNATHPITAALNLLLGKILSNAAVTNRKSLLTGLFVATLATESVQASKKYFPELVEFLQRVATSQVRQHGATPLAEGRFSIRDVIDFSAGEDAAKMVQPTDSVKAIALTLGLLEKLVVVYSGLPAYMEIFNGFEKVFLPARGHPFPETVAAGVAKFGELLAANRQARPFATFQKKKPAALELLEPRIDDKFDRSKASKMTTNKRLAYDKKRAVKGAKRELRRDNQFIARVQLDEQVKKDATRQRKVREIFTGLYSQEGEHKALQRQKAKFKV